MEVRERWVPSICAILPSSECGPKKTENGRRKTYAIGEPLRESIGKPRGGHCEGIRGAFRCGGLGAGRYPSSEGQKTAPLQGATQRRGPGGPLSRPRWKSIFYRIGE